MRLSYLVLGLHVLSGATWIVVCSAFLIGSASLSSANEARDLFRRVAPRLNQIGLGCALAILLTGLGNAAYVLQTRRGHLPAQFMWILTGKIALFLVMVSAQLAAVLRTSAIDATADTLAVKELERRRLSRLYGLIISAGAGALILGLWLAGSG